jgi:flagellar FliJ protein
MPGFRLGAVLRARKAQEDAAKAAALRARAQADIAATWVGAVERDLDDRPAPHEASALSFAATMSARNALASTLAAAIGAAQLAGDDVQDKLTDLTQAAIQRRTIEKLEERHAAARRRAVDTADAKAVDDLTTAAHSRRDLEETATGATGRDGIGEATVEEHG